MTGPRDEDAGGSSGLNLVAIDDPDDPRIEDYRNIRERDLAGRKGLFVAEGRVVVAAMLDGGRFVPDSFLILGSRLEGMRRLLARAPAGCPVHVAESAVIDAVAGFPVHRGILAVGRRAERQDAQAILAGLGAEALLVAAVGIANHDNMGAIFRNAAAFGVEAVLLDPTCCDPLYRKAIRVSVGHALTVPFARAPDAHGLIDLLAGAGFRIVSLSPSGCTSIRDLSPGGRTALLVGAEGEGLPPGVLARSRTVRIDMAAGIDSLNVATATAIALHRLFLSRD